MKRLLSVTVTIVALSACGGSSPTTPLAPAPPTASAPPPPPPPPMVTVSGRVTATNGGQPLPGVEAVVGPAEPTTTDGSGAFQSQVPRGFTTSLTLNGPGIVSRGLMIAIRDSRTIDLGAIALGGDFDLTFYRRFVRNAFDAPRDLEPLRRWTRTPQIYLKTVDEAGEAIHGPTLDMIEATIKDGVPRWTGGVLGTPSVTRGTESREGVSGWITVKFPAVQRPGRCGTALIAADGGWIELEYHVPDSDTGGCRVPGQVIAPRTVRHELGHALGFWHTGDARDVMSGLKWDVRDANMQPSARERYHAAIAYQRPVGNTDPDADPSGAVTLAPLRAIP